MAGELELETRVLRKAALRIVPFIMLLYFVAFIDRVNIGFAALTMNKDLGLSPAVFGFGAGIFFWGYFLFEVPSNIILHKVGARIWIARVMISWGSSQPGWRWSAAPPASTPCASCSARPKRASFPASSSICPTGFRRDSVQR